MFAELFTAALNAIKLAPRYPAPIGIVAAALVFIPQEYLQVIGVHQLAQDYRPVLGCSRFFGSLRWRCLSALPCGAQPAVNGGGESSSAVFISASPD